MNLTSALNSYAPAACKNSRSYQLTGQPSGFAPKILLACILLLLLPASGLLAQACFKTDYVAGCAPLKVTATNCSSTNDPKLILYDFGAGKGGQSAPEYTYTEPGTYFITQYINAGTGAKTDGTYKIVVYKPEPIDFAITFCSQSTISIEIKSKAFPEYQVDYGDGKKEIIALGDIAKHTYSDDGQKTVTVSGYLQGAPTTCGGSSRVITPMATLAKADFPLLKVSDNGSINMTFSLNPAISYKLSETQESTGTTRLIDLAAGQTSHTVTGNDPTISSFLYRIDAYDPCSKKTIPSGITVGTFALKLAATAGRNALSWNFPLYFGFQNYTLYRNDQVLKVITDNAATSYVDTDLKCNQTYCYRLEVNLHGGKSKSISAEKCVKVGAISTPVAVTNLSSTVESEVIQLNWQSPPGITIQAVTLLRSKNGGAFEKITIPPKAPYRDLTADLKGGTYCYKITYRDECGNDAPESNTTCPVLLKGTIDEKDIVLNWTMGGQRQGSYVLEKLGTNNQPVWAMSTGDTTYTDAKDKLSSQLTRYRVRAASGGMATYSNIITVKIPAYFICPNAFSPNEDGLNDTFKVNGVFISGFRITIYDRWGIAVYSSDNMAEGWDGQFQGKATPNGEYAFLIEATDTIGRVLRQRGMIMLIR